MHISLVSLLALATVLAHPVFALPVDLPGRDSGIAQNNPVISQVLKITNTPFINGDLGREEALNTAGGVLNSALVGLRKRLVMHANSLLSPIIGPSVGESVNNFEEVLLCNHSLALCNSAQTKTPELDAVAAFAGVPPPHLPNMHY
ncbi:hypothetical protein BJ165DRAFT_1501280 [Panaeolus papilionaceus]|nr:hypothetical protein BJ165DRAFT_1501280 [Panaeolus papilionaceus]